MSPRFYSTYVSHIGTAESHDKIVLDIMTTVHMKLSGREWPPTEPAVLDASTIGILSAQFLLDLSPAASSSRKYEEVLVHSHLRMVYSVSHENATMVMGSSPEPVIAEAAAPS
jgi:hypothetical protein